MTRRLGTPNLSRRDAQFTRNRVWNGDVLLQGVESADAIRLREPVILAAVDDEHGSRPLVDEVDRVISARKNQCDWIV